MSVAIRNKSDHTIKDGSSFLVDVRFYDEDEALAAPTSASYRIDCLTNGTEVKGDTAIASPGSLEEIAVTGAENTIIDDTNEKETRRLTVTSLSAGGTSANNEYIFYIENLQGVN